MLNTSLATCIKGWPTDLVRQEKYYYWTQQPISLPEDILGLNLQKTEYIVHWHSQKSSTPSDARELDGFGSWRLHRGLLRVWQLPLTYCSTYLYTWLNGSCQTISKISLRLNNPNTSNSCAVMTSEQSKLCASCSAPSYMIHGLWPFITISTGLPSWWNLISSCASIHKEKPQYLKKMTPFYPLATLGWRGIVIAWVDRRIGVGQRPEPCEHDNFS